MPQIAIAAGMSAALSVSGTIAAGATISAGIAAINISTVAFAAAMGGASAFLQQQLAPSASAGDQSATVSSRQAIAPARIIYGETMVGGLYVYQGTKVGDKDFLNLIVVWAAHRCEEISEIWHGNHKIWDIDDGTSAGHDGTGTGEDKPRNYSNNVTVVNKLGTENQTVITAAKNNISDWTDDHRLRGCCYSYIRLKHDRKRFPRGLLNIRARIKGKRITDTRTNTTVYSENPAMCLRDYLKEYCGFTNDNLNSTQFQALANICDESVSTNSGTDNRYRISAAINENESRESVVSWILATMNARAAWIGGKFYVSGGAYEPPTLALTEADITGQIQVTTRRGRRDRWNRVKGRFANEAISGIRSAYTPREYPGKSSAAYQEADGEELTLIWDLPYVPRQYQAQRLAKLKLLQSRQEITAKIPVTLKGLQAVASGSLTLTIDRLGWNAKEFEVVDLQIGVSDKTPSVILSVRETSEDIWDWTTSLDEDTDPAGDPTDLEDAFDIDPPNQPTVTDELVIYRQEAITVLSAEIIGDGTPARYEVEAEIASPASGDISGYRPMSGTSADGRFELSNVRDGVVYNIRARAISQLGIASDWTTPVAHSVVGKTAPPAQVTGLRAETLNENAVLNWDPVSDLDLSHYVIRHQPVTFGSLWANATTIAERVARPATSASVPAIVGTYSIKAVDKLGNESTSPDAYVLTSSGVEGYSTLQTISESPTFGGTLTGLAADGGTGNLRLTASGGDFSGPGNYVLATTVDLGAVYNARIEADLTYSRYEEGANMDGWDQTIDSYAVNWDVIGITSGESDIVCRFEVRATDDDPSRSPTWGAWTPITVSGLNGRGFQFRVYFDTSTAVASPDLAAVVTRILMKRRDESGNSEHSAGTGYDDVAYGADFYTEPTVQITPTTAMATGDYYYLDAANTDRTGFRVIFKNSSDAAITRDYNWTAIGPGRSA